LRVNGFVFLEQPLKGLDKLPKVLSTPHGTLGAPNDHIN